MIGKLFAGAVIKYNRMITAMPLPISAQITTADPDIVAVTFNQDVTGSSETDWTLAGKTISAINIVGAVVYLTVSTRYH